MHLSGRDLDGAILGAYGKHAKDSNKPKLLPQKCARCGEVNAPASVFCTRCGLPLDKDSFLVRERSIEEKLKELEEEMEVLKIVKQLLSKHSLDKFMHS